MEKRDHCPNGNVTAAEVLYSESILNIRKNTAQWQYEIIGFPASNHDSD
jgi:hypothetical protein